MKFIHCLYKKWLNNQINLYKEKEELLQLKDIFNQHKNKYHKKETSKLVLWFMLILLLTIVVFTGYVTLQMMAVAASIGGMMDFTPLVALISAIIGQVIITLGYFIKSTKENSEGGVTYLNAQYQLNNDYEYPEENLRGDTE